MTKGNMKSEDTFALKRKLVDALSNPNLLNAEATIYEQQDAALWVAIALGKCQLFGVDAQEIDGILPLEIAIDACKSAYRLTKEFKSRVSDLVSEHEELDEDSTIIACQVMTDRMDLWAADVAITEVWEIAIANEELGHLELDRLFVSLINSISELDEALQSCQGVLFTAASTNLISNWRQMLSLEYQETLPWWLDGIIESELQTAESFADSIISADVSATTAVVESRPPSKRGECSLPDTYYIVDLPRSFNSLRNESLLAHSASPSKESPCESRRYAIMGDPDSSARVSLEIDSSDSTRDVIFVELIRSSLAYTAASVHFSDGTSTAMEFDGQTGRLSVIAGINSFQIQLVDRSGGEHILTEKEI